MRDGKGRKDRPKRSSYRCASTWPPFACRHQRNLAAGHGAVELRDALRRKYPAALSMVLAVALDRVPSSKSRGLARVEFAPSLLGYWAFSQVDLSWTDEG